jgi:hypothetical protein
MNKKTWDALIFMASVISLVVTLLLLWRFGAYEITYGNSTVVIDGGWFLIIMNAIRVIALSVVCVISGIRLFRRSLNDTHNK